MISIPDIQTFRANKNAGDEGTIYIGTAGNNPIDTPVNVYTDYAGTNSVSTPIRLDSNGYPVVDGVIYNALYVDFSYSIQIIDDDNAELYSPFISSDV